MPRFLIGGISHETNTFSPIRTTLDLFERRALVRGPDMIEQTRGVRSALGGMIDGADQRGWDLVPTLFASATPSGLVARDTYESLAGEIIAGLESAGEIDGVLLPLHGAMVVEDFDDGEGELLRRIRDVVGMDLPVVVTLDFHATLTPAIAHFADIVIGYETYPHIDPYDRGIEAAMLMERVLSGEVQPANALRQIPMLTPLPPQWTWGPTPMRDLMQMSLEMEREPGVLCIMLAGGFPYSDIPDAGVSVLVTTDNDAVLAGQVAERLARACWERREDFLAHLMSPLDAVEHIRAATAGPIVLADVADNPGAGSSCDGTVMLQALLESGLDGVAVGTITDPETVARADEIGIGNTGTVHLGGKVDDLHGPTLEVEAYVRSVADISFINTGQMGTGGTTHLGRTAMLESHGVSIIVPTNRVQTLDPELFRAVGIPPEEQRALLVKSSVHFRAGFEPIAAEIIEIDTPGLSSPNLRRFDYERVRRPIWPLDADARM